MHNILKATAFSKAFSGLFWFGYLWRIIVFWEKTCGKSKDFGGRGKGKNCRRGGGWGGLGDQGFEGKNPQEQVSPKTTL